jgi:AbrB family looped-hinge helix DNA binding protein
MRTTMDKLGRIVVPKSIRDRMQLAGGEALEIDERDGVVEIRPLPAAVRVVDTIDGPIGEAVEPIPSLSDDVVRNTLDRVRR